MSLVCLSGLCGCSEIAKTVTDLKEATGVGRPEDNSETLTERPENNGETLIGNAEDSIEALTGNTETSELTLDDLDNLTKVSTEQKEEVRARSEGRFYYELLNDEDKELYLEIFLIVSAMANEIKVSSVDMDKIERVFDYVLNDHPEFFYVDGYEFKKYMVNDELVSVAVGGSYCMTRDEVTGCANVMAAYLTNFIMAFDEKYPDSSDDYEKVRFTYEYVITNTEYDTEAPNNQNIISVMEGKRSVCQGYAKTTQLLLQTLGIEATLVTGVGHGEKHSWNLVKSGGDYYLVDTTWGDASYMVASGEEDLLESIPPIGYDYLLFNENMDRGVHIPNDREIIPLCTATRDNYYYREGLYFEEVDEERIENAFRNAYSRNDEYVVFKMNNNQTYKDMLYYMIGDQHAFDYIKDKKSVNYAQSPERLYLVFWI